MKILIKLDIIKTKNVLFKVKNTSTEMYRQDILEKNVYKSLI